MLRALLLTLLCLLAAGAPAQRYKTQDKLLVGTNWLARNIQDPSLVVLHIADDRSRYDQAHIPGARFVAMKELAVTRNGVPNELPPIEDLTKLLRRLGIDGKDRIVLYDEELGMAAARAYVTFDYLGLGDRTALLNGQFRTWEAESRPTTPKAPADATPTEFEPIVRPEVIASLDLIRTIAAGTCETTTTLIDARPPAEFAGTMPGQDIARGGHIPNAESIYWKQAILGEAKPLLRSDVELRKLFPKPGKDDMLVTYCRSGRQASFSYFVMRYLGYPVKLYDGSFYEWSHQADTEVLEGAPPTPAPTGT